MPNQTLRERLPRAAFTITTRTALAATMLVGAVGCGSHGSDSDSGGRSVADLDLGAVQTLRLDANDTVGVTSTGVYTVADGKIYGVDYRSGAKSWQIQPPTAPVDKDRIQVLDTGKVLLAGWQGTAGLTAYDADTGVQLFWSTPNDEWAEADDATGQFVHTDPRTGQQSWTVDPATVGCATPLSKDSPALFDSDVATLAAGPGVDIFRCPAPGGRYRIGGLDRASGKAVWQREVPDERSFLRATGRIGLVVSDGSVETIDTSNGKSLGSRKPASDKEFRIPQPDGSALTLDSYVFSEDKEMRLTEPGGATRWTVPLDATKEQIQPLTVSGGNAVLALMQERSDAKKTWLLAYDPKNGKRTVVIGPGPTAAGEKPTLTMGLEVTGTRVYDSPWGVLVAGPGNTYATIPATR